MVMVLILRADVFRPIAEGRSPVLITYGPYAKGLTFWEGYSGARLEPNGDRTSPCHRGSTNEYQNWEVVDPEKWVPDGYICIRVGSKGVWSLAGLYRSLFPA
jgi:uncharacterized protein